MVTLPRSEVPIMSQFIAISVNLDAGYSSVAAIAPMESSPLELLSVVVISAFWPWFICLIVQVIGRVVQWRPGAVRQIPLRHLRFDQDPVLWFEEIAGRAIDARVLDLPVQMTKDGLVHTMTFFNPQGEEVLLLCLIWKSVSWKYNIVYEPALHVSMGDGQWVTLVRSGSDVSFDGVNLQTVKRTIDVLRGLWEARVRRYSKEMHSTSVLASA